MPLEEVQHRPGEETHRQEGDDEAQGIHPDEEESRSSGTCRGGHEQHAAQGGAHTGGPGEAEGKAQHQGGDGVHGPFIQAQGQAVLLFHCLGFAKDAQLVEAKEDHNGAADPGKPHPVAAEEPAEGGKAEAQRHKGEADTQDEEEGVHHHPAPGIVDSSVLSYGAGASCQVADIERHQRQDAGGKEAEQALHKDGEDRNTGFQGKSHIDCSPFLGQKTGTAKPCRFYKLLLSGEAGRSCLPSDSRGSCPCSNSPDPSGCRSPAPQNGGDSRWNGLWCPHSR